ncbi:hypothetical protein FRB94_005605 [Tulasnella sp. JGI-2019a]|nr:hypothetical protein FRB94_005605 [Tulasnella sp. JGI-2019a]
MEDMRLVSISPSALVAALRQAIALKFAIDNYELDRMKLYRVSRIGIQLNTESSFEPTPIYDNSPDPILVNQKLQSIEISSSEQVQQLANGMASVSSYFSSPLVLGLHSIVYMQPRQQDLPVSPPPTYHRLAPINKHSYAEDDPRTWIFSTNFENPDPLAKTIGNRLADKPD